MYVFALIKEYNIPTYINFIIDLFSIFSNENASIKIIAIKICSINNDKNICIHLVKNFSVLILAKLKKANGDIITNT